MCSAGDTKRRHLLSGFTLIELMVVMAVITILALIIIGAIVMARRMSIETAHRGNLKTVEAAVNAYYAKNKQWPFQNSIKILGESSTLTTLGITASQLSADPPGVCIYSFGGTNTPSYGIYIYGYPFPANYATTAINRGTDLSQAKILIVTLNYECDGTNNLQKAIQFTAMP